MSDTPLSIDDLARAVARLSEERDLLRRLMDTTPDHVYLKDKKSRFVINNRAHLELLGASSQQEVVGTSDFDFFPREQASRYHVDEQSILMTGQPIVDREEQVTTRGGVVLWMSTTKVALLDSHGEISGIVGISRDISSRRRAEDESAILHEQLRQAQKLESIGQLAGGIAHDFNNMLGAISGYAIMIQRKFAKDNAVLGEYVGVIIDASRRAADLTSKLLAFARRGTYEMLVVDTHETIDDVVKLLKHTIDKKISIIQRLEATPCTVMGDRTQLQNAVLNLAVNARDAMPDGGDLTFTTRIIDIDADFIRSKSLKLQAGRFITMSVSDTGVGMDEATKARMFEPFFTTKKVGKGTGLGLASVYGTMKSHNGAIVVESELGMGITFTMYIPLVDRPVAKVEVLQHAMPRGKARILVVDDEDMVREMAKRMLEELGYTVVTCRDGMEAVDYYKVNKADIDLCIVDMIMPRIGGHDCVYRLKLMNPDVKIIIATGYSVATDTQRIITKGISGFIQKPFEIEDLAEMVSKALAGAMLGGPRGVGL